MRLGIDPGLKSTGWGVIAFNDGRLRHIANGAIQPKSTLADADRLGFIFNGLGAVIAEHSLRTARNPARPTDICKNRLGSALHLGMARGVGIRVRHQGCGTTDKSSARAVKKGFRHRGGWDKKRTAWLPVY